MDGDDKQTESGGFKQFSQTTDRDGTRDPGGPGGDTGNRPVPDTPTADAGERDPFAYRNDRENGKRRADHMERLLIDQYYGGDTRRFDEAAGLDFDA